jgi:glucans biosynthesis protein
MVVLKRVDVAGIHGETKSSQRQSTGTKCVLPNLRGRNRRLGRPPSFNDRDKIVRRRDLLLGGAAWSVLYGATSQESLVRAAGPDVKSTPFTPQTVRQFARELSQKAHRPSDLALPAELKDLSYDQYRTIRFLPDRALWRNDRLPFQVEFFHRGFFFDRRVDIFEVDQGQARRIAYSPSMFSFGDLKSPDANTDLGFAGFRLHYPINRPDYFDEFAVFLGATYFRAVAKGQGYGLSARGLAINTGDPKGEEFPAFTSFWIERPQPNATSIVVHALLESPSTTGAYRFTIRPGQETTFDVEPVLFPRTDIAQAGIAPLTSMFLFDANDRKNVDDYRSAVHDSDGLAIHNGRDERLWRQLNNPSDLQISSFGDTNPRGFGLMQRQKSFGAYEDLESHFERRPSLWVEPIGDWGEGEVRLVEIPTKEEIHDNIVGLWLPRGALAAKGEHSFTYRLHWKSDDAHDFPLARFATTRVGAGPGGGRLFVLDLIGDKLKEAVPQESVRGQVSASKGKIDHVISQPNSETGGWRLSFQLASEKESLVELRAQLMRNDVALSEVWLYRWTP